MKVVLDTNVWISGLLLPESDAGKIINGWQLAKFDVVSSMYILQEIAKVSNYPKISKRLQWNKDKIKNYLELLAFFTTLVELKGLVDYLLNPKDAPVLDTLASSQADYLITGDDDLLKLRNQFPIVTIVEFLNEL